MSTTRFNISENTPAKNPKQKSNSKNITPKTEFFSDNSRSCAGNRTSSNFNLDDELIPTNSLSLSLIKIKKHTTTEKSLLHERLHNEAKEFKEKLKSKENENLQKIKREAIPKIHKFSQQIERKQELFAERLYPYHKLNKLENANSDEDSVSFEYAHVATVRSNPLAISGEFYNDDFRNNVDCIFCDDQEIKDLYGNKPSFVKIYRGIKHLKKPKHAFKPTLSKNTCRIVQRIEAALPLRKCRSNCVSGELAEKNDFNANRFSLEFYEDLQCEKNFEKANLNENENTGFIYNEGIKTVFDGNSKEDFLVKFQKGNSEKAIELKFNRLVSDEIIKNSDMSLNQNTVGVNRNNYSRIVNRTGGTHEIENYNQRNFKSNNQVNIADAGSIDFNLNGFTNNKLKSNKINEVKDILKEQKGMKNTNYKNTTVKKPTLEYFKNPIKRESSTDINTNLKKSYTTNYSIMNKIKNCKETTQKFKKIQKNINSNFYTSLNFQKENKSISKIKIESNIKKNIIKSSTTNKALILKSINKNNSSFVTNNSSKSTNYTKKQPDAAYLKMQKNENESASTIGKQINTSSVYNYNSSKNKNNQKYFNNEQQFYSSNNQSFLSNNTANNNKSIKNDVFKTLVRDKRSSSARSNKSNVSQVNNNYDLSKSVSNSFNEKSSEFNKKFRINKVIKKQVNDNSYNSNFSGISINKKNASVNNFKNNNNYKKDCWEYKKNINRAGSMGNCNKDNLRKNYIRINKGVYEIEDNFENEMIDGNRSIKIIGNDISSDKNPSVSAMINKNMNINFSVNFLMNE